LSLIQTARPGPAALGAVLYQDGTKVAEISEYLGEQTNNWAEYEGLIRALRKAQEVIGEALQQSDVEIRMDSQLIVRQINGEYRVKEPALKEQYLKVKDLLARHAPHARFVHIPREENKEADRLCNQALDAVA
jgi:ribonuclease HI